MEFFGEPISYGGQEAFIINFYNSLESRDINYTFCTPFNCDNEIVKDMIVERGDTVISYNKNFNSGFRKFHIVTAAKTILSKNDYDVVHIHSGSIYTLKNVAKIAKKYGAKKVIVHSHATGHKNLKYKIIKKLSDICIDKYVDEYFACSLAAGQWKFPEKIINGNSFSIIKNGIITEKYSFSEQKRSKYRNNLGLTDCFTICQVGRFAHEKNHNFTLSVLQRLKEMNFNFRCVFVGDGLLKQEIVEKVKALGLTQDVIFLEKRNDVAEIMMASDVCLFPSVFEGLGMTVIEAQATGLKTIISENVPDDVMLTDLVVKLPTYKSDEWVEEIIRSKSVVNRAEYNALIENSEFNAKIIAEKLENIYKGYIK